MSTVFQIDRFLLSATIIVVLITIGIHLWDDAYFTLVYAIEDGVVEYATALFLFVGSIMLLLNARSLAGRGLRLAFVLTLLYAFVFFVGAGEEVSWGQRIFGWESGEFFIENNQQNETNLHNLVVFGVHLAKTLFGNFLTIVILLYLVALPLLYPRVEGIQRLVDRLAIPVPGIRHMLLAVGASLVIAIMDQHRKWEVYELIFSMIMLSIFLLPQNREQTR